MWSRSRLGCGRKRGGHRHCWNRFSPPSPSSERIVSAKPWGTPSSVLRAQLSGPASESLSSPTGPQDISNGGAGNREDSQAGGAGVEVRARARHRAPGPEARECVLLREGSGQRLRQGHRLGRRLPLQCRRHRGHPGRSIKFALVSTTLRMGSTWLGQASAPSWVGRPNLGDQIRTWFDQCLGGLNIGRFWTKFRLLLTHWAGFDETCGCFDQCRGGFDQVRTGCDNAGVGPTRASSGKVPLTVGCRGREDGPEVRRGSRPKLGQT